MKRRLLAPLLSAACFVGLCAALPAITGCGAFGDCFDDLLEDLDDADDNEDVGEAWDDFFDCIED